MTVTESIFSYIDLEFSIINNLEKEQGLSTGKLFNIDSSNHEILRYELFQFLLSIIEHEKTTELQCDIFSAIAGKKISINDINSLKKVLITVYHSTR